MPKEIESLRVLRKQIYDERPASQAVEWNTKAAHVLITGAGFEIRDDETGIGLPLTKQILLETQLLPSGTRKRSRHERFIEWNMEESGYPWPTLGIVGGKDRVRLETAARAKNLDVYWDVLLSAVHSLYEVTVDETLTSREQAKADAANLEFRLREGFRRSIVKYDMGQMAQSLAAARISWKAWLTTNYTNFIDRAIEVSAHNRSLWRLLQTPIEAEVFLSEQLARGDLDAGLAVKLHGDIAHAHTMALAGHDKEVISPLFVRPTLSVMYAAATEALCACLTRSKNELPKECWWHVVGHGLEDRPLLALIRNVTERTGGVKHSFRVVSLDPERVITSLRHALDPNTSCDIQAEQMTAVQYMSQLRDGSFRASPNSSIPPPPAPNDGLGFGTEGHTVPDERWPDDRPRA